MFMKRLFLFLMSIFIVSFVQGQTMLWHYGFEQPNGYTAPNGEHNDGSYDYFARVTNADISPTYNNPDQQYFFAAQDIDADGGSNPDSILINPIDVSGATQSTLTFSVYLTTAYSNTWDNNDYVHFYYSYDGTTYNNLLWVESDTTGFNGKTRIDTDFDGLGDGAIVPNTFTQFTAEIPYSGESTLYIKIKFSLNANHEDIGLDSMVVYDGVITPPNPLLQAATYYFSDLEDFFIVGKHQNPVSSPNASDYILKPDNVTFNNASVLPEDNTVVILSPAGTIASDNQLDTLVYIPNEDSIPFYAGILPINYLNTIDPNLIQDGYNVTLMGVVTANDGYNQIWIQGNTFKSSPGAKLGLLLFDPTHEYVGDVHVGDLVEVVGQRSTYNGMTELVNILALDSIDQGLIDTVQINPADIDIHKPQDDPIAEQWEGQLVRIDSITIYDYNSSYYEYYGVSQNGDSVIIDDDVYYHFGNDANFMEIGKTYNITGVITYTYGHYKINPRDTNDIEEVVIATNENHLINAANFDFAGDGSQLYVVAQHQDTVASPNAGDYILQPGDISFGNAFNMPDEPTLVILVPNTSLVADTTLDTLFYTPYNDTAVFYAGITPVHYLNTANDSLIENGYNVTLIGVVTANDNYNQIWIQDAAAPKHGLLLFDQAQEYVGDVHVGDLVEVIGQRSVYNGMTELTNLLVIDSIAAGQPVIPIKINPADIDIHKPQDDPTAEQWEGQLVKIDSITIYDYNSNYHEYYGVSQNGDSVIVDDDAYYHFGNDDNFMEVGKIYNITGVITYAYGHYKINPRDTNDVEEVIIITPDATILPPDEQIAGDTLFIDENINFGNAVAVVKFKISDLGNDGLPTIVTRALTVAGPQNTANFRQELEGGVLIDQDNNIVSYSADPIIKPDSIILPIDGSTMTIPDGQTVEYTAYLWLRADSAVDGHVLQLQVNADHGFIADSTGSQFVNQLDNAITSEPFIITYHPTGVPMLATEIYPNPATDYVKFRGIDVVKAQVLTVNGKEIMNLSVQDNTLNISSLSSGTYLLKLITKDNKLIIHKLIKH